MSRLFLAIDFESWIFSDQINQKKLTNKQLLNLDRGYTPRALNYLLKITKKYNQKIIFFVVSKLEELYPGIHKEILRHGHEVGWHTYSHAVIKDKETLRRELESSKEIIRKYKVRGFQAPAITFVKEGYKILKDYGFTYSSSIYGNSDVIHNFGGISEIPVSASNTKHKPKKKEVKFPSNMNVSGLLRFGIPYGSGYFWGILGKNYYHKKLTASKKNRKIANLFIHEWQLIRPTSDEYKKDIKIFSRPLFLPYRLNVSHIFEHLLANFRFQRFKDFF